MQYLLSDKLDFCASRAYQQHILFSSYLFVFCVLKIFVVTLKLTDGDLIYGFKTILMEHAIINKFKLLACEKTLKLSYMARNLKTLACKPEI